MVRCTALLLLLAALSTTGLRWVAAGAPLHPGTAAVPDEAWPAYAGARGARWEDEAWEYARDR